MCRKRLTQGEQCEVVRRFNTCLEPAISIAEAFGVTRQAIYKVLQRNGVDTEKRKYPTVCANCGADLMRTRQRLRDNERQFCSQACYHAHIEKIQPGGYHATRTGSRAARGVVSGLFSPLSSQDVVHHIDRNTGNNHPSNLMVFRSHSEHLQYHRREQNRPEPIWDGRRASYA